jgi:hypothetical protein
MDTWSVPSSSSDYRRKSVGIKEFADPLQGTFLVMRDVLAIFQMSTA